MKILTKMVMLGVIACFVLMNGLWFYSEQRDRVRSEINACFQRAASNDLTMRWEKRDLPIYHHVSTEKTDDSIVIRNKDGVKVVPAFEKTLSEEEQFKSILQTTLRYENPVNANALDSIYQMELKGQNIFLETAVCYMDKMSGKIYKSSNDTSFYKHAYLLPPVAIGIEKEIVLQAFANVTFFSIIRSSISLFGGWIILCVAFIFSAVSLFRKKAEQIVTISGNAVLEKGDVEIQIEDGLILNTELHVLKYGESTISLTAQSVSLLKLFLSHKDYFVSNDDIREHLWGAIDYSDSCRNQAIKRLRDALKSIPTLHVENVRGTGFRLVTDTEVHLSN